jgi:hypothetical protein
MAIEREVSLQKRWELELNRTRKLSHDHPDLRVEWVVSDKFQACEYCRNMNGKSFTLAEAEKLYRHEGCRCILVPIFKDPEK